MIQKKIIVFFLIFIFGQIFGQIDKNGNPVFNSVSISEKPIGELLLLSNYYTLKNNIENKLSSVFISEKPTLSQVEQVAINLPSDHFVLTKDNKVIAMIMLQNFPRREFMVVEMNNNNVVNYPCKLKGDITENRAVEIIKEKYDSTAIIKNDKLKFNGKEFEIISSKNIEEAVLVLINKEKLNEKEPSNVVILSKNEIEAYILSETKVGGKLDFFTEIKGKEYDAIQVKPGMFTTRQGVAFYKWGRACFDIGVNSLEDAYQIFEIIKEKPINIREKEYIKQGFYKDWEKE